MSNGIDESFLKGAAEEIFEIIPKTVSEEILKEIFKIVVHRILKMFSKEINKAIFMEMFDGIPKRLTWVKINQSNFKNVKGIDESESSNFRRTYSNKFKKKMLL